MTHEATTGAGEEPDPHLIEAIAEAICRQMRSDLKRSHDWAREPEWAREAFRKAARAAEAAHRLYLTGT